MNYKLLLILYASTYYTCTDNETLSRIFQWIVSRLTKLVIFSTVLFLLNKNKTYFLEFHKRLFNFSVQFLLLNIDFQNAIIFSGVKNRSYKQLAGNVLHVGQSTMRVGCFQSDRVQSPNDGILRDTRT